MNTDPKISEVKLKSALDDRAIVVCEDQRQQLVNAIKQSIQDIKARGPVDFTYSIETGYAGQLFMVVAEFDGLNGWQLTYGQQNRARVVLAALDTTTGQFKSVRLLKSGEVKQPKKQPKATIDDYTIGNFGLVDGTRKAISFMKVECIRIMETK